MIPWRCGFPRGDQCALRYIIGGAGYTGAHVKCALQEQGAPIVVIGDPSTGLPRRAAAPTK
jgi:hypothetical protein